jgi:hypothetical protein
MRRCRPMRPCRARSHPCPTRSPRRRPGWVERHRRVGRPSIQTGSPESHWCSCRWETQSPSKPAQSNSKRLQPRQGAASVSCVGSALRNERSMVPAIHAARRSRVFGVFPGKFRPNARWKTCRSTPLLAGGPIGPRERNGRRASAAAWARAVYVARRCRARRSTCTRNSGTAVASQSRALRSGPT